MTEKTPPTGQRLRAARYPSGAEARCGDVVRGRTYNCVHEVVGVLISLSPDVVECACQVAYTTKADVTLMSGTPQKPIVVVQKIDWSDLDLLERLC